MLSISRQALRGSRGLLIYSSRAGLSSFEDKWTAATADIRSDLGYDDSSKQLRKIIKGGLLRFTDIRDNPTKFFDAHRILARNSPVHGPGFSIRFTVQYNLFAGTILGLGKPEQLTILEDMQSKGQLGCFALTEKFAGVNSGMIAGTTAHWDNSSQTFTINTPTTGARKNWISQGFVADKAVVVADLFVDGKSHGPHAFVMDLRVDGKVVEGVTLEDMGRKTVGNDLDNAAIHFDHIKVPKSALLNRYADIVDGKYVQAIKGIRTMDMIGQRLFSGRIAVAWGALIFRKKLFEMTKLYSDNKKCWGPDGDVPLTNIPQLKHLYIEAEDKAKDLETFAWKLEEELAACLVKSEIPSPELQEAIAIAKVRCVETSIDLCFRLKQEVGSYALMGGTGFEQADFLQCCKFAEGDTRILSQKIARDRFKVFSKSGKVVDEETKVAAELASNLVKDMKGGMDKFAAWDNNWTLVYKLANTRMDAVYNQYMKK